MKQGTVAELPALGDVSEEEQVGDLPARRSHLHLAEQRLADYQCSPTDTRPAGEIIDRLVAKARQ
jgi:hypothetical protein